VLRPYLTNDLMSQNDCFYLIKYNSQALMSQNVIISENYVIKLILKKCLVQVDGFMMW